MSDFTSLNYQGPDRNYKAPIGQSFVGGSIITNTTTIPQGYHDVDHLKDLLNSLVTDTSLLYAECENKLADYSLNIQPDNANLLSAQKIAYPGTDIPDVITFQEYKYLWVNNNSNAAQYIISAFEDSVRSPVGTNALDISIMLLLISNEAKRIKEFIDGYVGDLDDTSEHRTVELFQDWAEDAAIFVKGLRQALTGSVSTELPRSEVDQLDSETATQLQAFFLLKFNVINQGVRDDFSKLIKTWDKTATLFYKKNLGPALHFQLNVARNLFGQINSDLMPTIANETVALGGVHSNYRVALADQLKRNEIFHQYASDVQAQIFHRDTYFRYINQLAQKGRSIKDIFSNESGVVQHPDIVNADHPLSVVDHATIANDNFNPSHGILTDLDSAVAHPQYLLRSGGTASKISGNVFVVDGATIDGIDLNLHAHNGSDGSARISGADIAVNSISEAQIDVTTTTPVPYNLILTNEVPIVSPIGVTTMTVQVEFDIANSNVSGYEFEIVELS